MSALEVQLAPSPAMREGLAREPPWRESHLHTRGSETVMPLLLPLPLPPLLPLLLLINLIATQTVQQPAVHEGSA
jgi:hypothetical protein